MRWPLPRVKSTLASIEMRIPINAMLARRHCNRVLQRFQELDDGLLFPLLQFLKFLGYMVCLASMPQDRVAKCQGCAIVHQSRTQADSPQRCGAYFVPTALEILFRQIA